MNCCPLTNIHRIYVLIWIYYVDCGFLDQTQNMTLTLHPASNQTPTGPGEKTGHAKIADTQSDHQTIHRMVSQQSTTPGYNCHIF